VESLHTRQRRQAEPVSRQSEAIMRSVFLARVMLRLAIAWLAGIWVPAATGAGLDPALVSQLVADDTDTRLGAIARLGADPDPHAAQILEALGADRLYVAPDGTVLVDTGAATLDAASGQPAILPDGASTVSINNRLRRAI